MLALSFLKYWWLRPNLNDPALINTPADEMSGQTMSSVMEPLEGPQFATEQHWTKVPYGALDSIQRSAVEIEKVLAKGNEMILIEPPMAGQLYRHFVNFGSLLHENTVFYGTFGLLISYFFPKTWYVYMPCSLLAFMHSWTYFKVYKFDRLSQYQAYDDDRHPLSNLVTACILGQRPAHFQYILKKEGVIVWELMSEVIMYSSMISCLLSLQIVEEMIPAQRFVSMHALASTESLSELLSLPAYSSGYFQPPELINVAAGMFLPSDIPNVNNWFDIPWFGFRMVPMKFDLALIVCALGGYFAYKLYEHLFEYDEGEEVSDSGGEWFDKPPRKKHPYWVEVEEEDSKGPSKASLEYCTHKLLKEQEEKMLKRLSGKVPYGYVRPGFPENHYAVFT